MNGARGRSNNYLLDGTDMNDGYRNDPAINEAGVFGTPATILPIDAIAELRVLSNFEPEYGRNAGAVVNIVTKSGTNACARAALRIFPQQTPRRTQLLRSSSQPKAPFHNNQFGGSLGGPIVKDKTFFYVDYEGQRELVGVVRLGCVPEPARSKRIAGRDGSQQSGDRACCSHNPWPAPKFQEFSSTDSGCTDWTECCSTIRPPINHVKVSSRRLTTASTPITSHRTLLLRRQRPVVPVGSDRCGGQLPGFDTDTPTRVQLVSLSYIRTIGSNKVNELRYGWNRSPKGFFPQDQSFHPSTIGLCSASSNADCPARID